MKFDFNKVRVKWPRVIMALVLIIFLYYVYKRISYMDPTLQAILDEDPATDVDREFGADLKEDFVGMDTKEDFYGGYGGYSGYSGYPQMCFNCDENLDFNQCSSCPNCNWCVNADTGSGKCTIGDARGPMFRKDCGQAYHMGRPIHVGSVRFKKSYGYRRHPQERPFWYNWYYSYMRPWYHSIFW